MPPVNLRPDLVRQARIAADKSLRSTPRQIEYWARIGKIAEENPGASWAEIVKGLIKTR